MYNNHMTMKKCKQSSGSHILILTSSLNDYNCFSRCISYISLPK